jgi:hypothetical protein
VTNPPQSCLTYALNCTTSSWTHSKTSRQHTLAAQFPRNYLQSGQLSPEWQGKWLHPTLHGWIWQRRYSLTTSTSSRGMFSKLCAWQCALLRSASTLCPFSTTPVYSHQQRALMLPPSSGCSSTPSTSQHCRQPWSAQFCRSFFGRSQLGLPLNFTWPTLGLQRQTAGGF